MPKRKRLEISLDSEAGGLDIYHIVRPFMVQIFDGETPYYWEWDVDPLTRQPQIPESDKDEIRDWLKKADIIVFQNGKFDIQILASIEIEYPEEYEEKTHDTLFASHLIASGEPHDLTTLALKHLRIDILPFEERLEKATREARKLVTAKRNAAEFKGWQIAKFGNPGLPSIKKSNTDKEGKTWKADMWLPRAIAKHRKYPATHPWWTVASEYGTTDTIVTLPIFHSQMRMLEEMGLMAMYEERRKLIPIIVDMETNGITYSQDRLTELKGEFKEDAEEAATICLNLGELDSLPKSGTSKAMRELLFKKWKLPIVKKGKSGEPSLDKNVLGYYIDTLPPNTKPLLFLKNLAIKRKRDTSISYMESYERFGLQTIPGMKLLHPSLNATGQKTPRWSAKNPNEQNISKQFDDDYKDEYKNVRYCFGPEPDREWWSLDYSNLELTLPAYECEEEAMIALFEKPEEGPFFGSYHLLNASILYPKEFYGCIDKGWDFKKKYKDTFYQWVKNTGFAKQYGAQEAKIDATAHKKGAFKLLGSSLPRIAALSEFQINYANKYGYVLTIPDNDLGSYRLQTAKGWGNKVLPTLPMSYHVQGSSALVIQRAMVRVQRYLRDLNVKVNLLKRKGYFITAQIHDELVFDFPKGETAQINLPIVLECKRLMEASGNDINIPLRVEYSFHPSIWSKEEKVEDSSVAA